MATITADLVRQLRESTGAGMMECKKALEENGADMDKAVKWLREKGIASAAKKAGRAAAEGLVSLQVSGAKGVIVEVNCETDFVARTDKFKDAVKGIAQTALGAWPAGSPADAAKALLSVKGADGSTVEDTVKGLIAGLGENMSLARVSTLQVKQGLLGSYVHSDGKLAALVAIECGKADSITKPEVLELARDLAMQVAGNLPPAEVITREQINPDIIAREREIAVTQAAQQGVGKPANIVEKIAEGKLAKVLQEITLMDQLFVKDSGMKVSELVKQVGAKAGDTLTISAFARIRVGA